MLEGEEPIWKFRDLDYKPRSYWHRLTVGDAVIAGIKEPTKSLISDKSNKNEIIKMLFSLYEADFMEDDIKPYVSYEGFDYQNFLYNAISNKKILYSNLVKLEDFVYYQELLSNPTKILERFKKELEDIEKLVRDKGVEALEGTSYGLIAFLCTFASKDAKFRKRHQYYLVSISRSIEWINEQRMMAKEKASVTYKGVNIRSYGDKEEALKKGLTMLMQAINLLPPAFKKQLSKVKYIGITDCGSPSNLNSLITKPSFLNSEHVKYFYALGTHDSSNKSIFIYDIERNFRNCVELASTLCHELAHSMAGSIGQFKVDFTEATKVWQNAKDADGNSVTPYGDTAICEDFAEFCEEYCDAMPLGRKLLQEKYPNRLKVLEAVLDLRMYNIRKPNRLPYERKMEILRLFEGAGVYVFETFFTKTKRKEMYALPPEKKLELAEEMVTQGIPLQFLYSIITTSFLRNMSSEDIRKLYEIYEPVGFKEQLCLLSEVDLYGNKTKIDSRKIMEGLPNIKPTDEKDAYFIESVAENIMAFGDETQVFTHLYDAFTRHIFSRVSDEVGVELVNLFLDALGKKEKVEKELK